MLKITYGTKDHNIDVTKIAYEKIAKKGIIYIPNNDNTRAALFTDPIYGVLKFIFIETSDNIVTEYNNTKKIFIDTNDNKIYVDNPPEYINNILSEAKNILFNIQSKLKLNYGNFDEEFPEQLMAVNFLTGDEKVLEIGGNIGRNSLIISYILNSKQNKNLVTLECDNKIYGQLKQNRDINNLEFYIENAALSKRKLIQRGWDTMPSDVLLPGYKSVNTITLEELYQKYNIEFDTLVLDCEGAFYYILMDMPEILKNIKLIIMENDYHVAEHKNYVNKVLMDNNFGIAHVEAGGWGPCYSNFFEVWKK